MLHCDRIEPMKTLRLLAAAALVAVVPLAGVAAQPFPAKQIRFVVPYPPGGPLDAVARLLGQKIAASIKHPVVVDNVPGAGGNIGAGVVARAAPDGHTILMGAVATHAINPTLYPSIPYNAEKDFIAVTQVASTPNVLVVNPAIEAATVAEFIKLAKSKPGKLNFGSGSTGSAGHLAGELFKTMAGVDMAHIPYKGPAGTKIPNQVLTSNPGRPDSAMVGSSGASGVRLAVVTASARTRPPFTCDRDEAKLSNMRSTRPATRSCIAPAAPL
jgi:tripartite-type tricarboxylate transporter receptor subunit TctC